MPTQPSTRKLLFATDRDHYRKTTTNQNAELWSPLSLDTSTLYTNPKTQGALEKRRLKDCTSERIKEFAVKWSPSNVKCYTYKSHQHDCLNMS